MAGPDPATQSASLEVDELALLEAEAALAEQEALMAEQKRCSVESQKGQLEASLDRKAAEVKQLRTDAAQLQRKVEEEEEYITNGLMRRLDVLQKEKDKLSKQVEAEEEFVSNSLKRQLTQLSTEKDALEKHLRKERQYIVKKLRRQLQQATDQNKELEKRIMGIEASTTPHGLMESLQAYKMAIGEGDTASRRGSTVLDSDTESSISAMSESTHTHAVGHDPNIRRMQKEITRLQLVNSSTSEEAEANAQKCEKLREELKRLSQDNFLRDVKALRMKQELMVIGGQRNLLQFTPPTTPRISPRSSSGSSTPTPGYCKPVRRATSQTLQRRGPDSRSSVTPRSTPRSTPYHTPRMHSDPYPASPQVPQVPVVYTNVTYALPAKTAGPGGS